uniref:Retrotransposon gag domain-containing protein n=1 Tax=Xiphophorus maculatus TaxID=8083 RepID=A0A3B5PP23_XIPMA
MRPSQVRLPDLTTFAACLPPSPSPFPSAQKDPLEGVLHQQNSILQHLHQMSNQLQILQDRIKPAPAPAPDPAPAPTSAAAAPTSSASAPSPSRDVIMPIPEQYSGELGKSKGFLLQCSLAFRRSPRSFPDDASKISFIVGLLRDRALRWAETVVDEENINYLPFDEFIELFKLTFCPKLGEEVASKRIWGLRQGNKSVADFAVEFRTLGTEAGWNEPALKGAFQQALNDRLKDELACRDEPDSLDELINLAIRIDNRLRTRSRSSNSQSSQFSFGRGSSSSDSSSPPIQNQPEPMQLGRARLTPEERQRRLASGCCLYCGSPQHFISACPIRPNALARQ